MIKVVLDIQYPLIKSSVSYLLVLSSVVEVIYFPIEVTWAPYKNLVARRKDQLRR